MEKLKTGQIWMSILGKIVYKVAANTIKYMRIKCSVYYTTFHCLVLLNAALIMSADFSKAIQVPFLQN